MWARPLDPWVTAGPVGECLKLVIMRVRGPPYGPLRNEC